MDFNKRICIVAPSLQLGGLENAVAVMANYFSEMGADVTLILIYKFPHFYTMDERIKIIEPDFDKNKLLKPIYYLKLIQYLNHELKVLKPETVLSYGDYMNVLVLMANLNLGLPLYISDRASPNLKFKLYQRIFRKFLYGKATGIIAQTDRAAEQKRKMLGDNINIIVIPNPIRKVRLFPEVKRENFIVAIARHYPVKGLDRLILAFSKLKSSDWSLIIAGSTGPSTPFLNNLVKSNNLSEKVQFLVNLNF